MKKPKFSLIHYEDEKNLYRFINPKYKDWQFVGIKNAFLKNEFSSSDLILAFKVKKGISLTTNFGSKKKLEESLRQLEDFITRYKGK